MIIMELSPSQEANQNKNIKKEDLPVEDIKKSIVILKIGKNLTQKKIKGLILDKRNQDQEVKKNKKA